MKLKAFTFALHFGACLGASLLSASLSFALTGNLQSPAVCALVLQLPADFVALSPLTVGALTTLARLRDAKSESHVLLRGETGTGKEVFADHLVKSSSRQKNTFITVNISGIPPELLATELFGSEKGAYTGATSQPGFVEQAEGGTLFVDEIGDLRLDVQMLLLRLLQNKTYYRVGSRVQKKANVRFVFATHQDLERMVAEGKFRADLYHRISQVTVQLAPLRERKEEIVPLANVALEQFATEANWQVAQLGQSTYVALAEYPWPGNVRELQNKVRAAALEVGSGGTIEAANLKLRPAHSIQVPTLPTSPDTLNVGIARGLYGELIMREALQVYEHAERNVLKAALQRNGFDILATSIELSLSYDYVRYRMRALNILMGEY